jgi:hypothetical protein
MMFFGILVGVGITVAVRKSPASEGGGRAESGSDSATVKAKGLVKMPTPRVSQRDTTIQPRVALLATLGSVRQFWDVP